MARFTITLEDVYVAGLVYKRDEYNTKRGTAHTTEEFISMILQEWSRHALTKKDKVDGEDIVRRIRAGEVEVVSKTRVAPTITAPAARSKK